MEIIKITVDMENETLEITEKMIMQNKLLDTGT